MHKFYPTYRDQLSEKSQMPSGKIDVILKALNPHRKKLTRCESVLVMTGSIWDGAALYIAANRRRSISAPKRSSISSAFLATENLPHIVWPLRLIYQTSGSYTRAIIFPVGVSIDEQSSVRRGEQHPAPLCCLSNQQRSNSSADLLNQIRCWLGFNRINNSICKEFYTIIE